jgi:hypothetical protein
MWTIENQPIGTDTIRFRFHSPGEPVLQFGDAIELWAAESKAGSLFRLFTSLAIASSNFQAFRWETPAITSDSIQRDFEFVLVNSPNLDRPENGAPFHQPFQTGLSTTPTTVTFSNLANSAILIAPLPANTPDVNHCHLGSYLRTADQTSGSDIWKAIGLAMKERVGPTPVWLNTAGGGVAWLHIRLDDRPKYYQHSAYKSASQN